MGTINNFATAIRKNHNGIVDFTINCHIHFIEDGYNRPYSLRAIIVNSDNTLTFLGNDGIADQFVHQSKVNKNSLKQLLSNSDVTCMVFHEPTKKIEVRIKFDADIVITGDTMQDVREKFESMELWSQDAKDCHVEFSEIQLIEDADTYNDLQHDYDHCFDTGGE